MILDSAHKHGITDETIWYVMENPEIAVIDPDRTGKKIALLIGHPHPQSLEDDYVEVLAELFDHKEAEVFHAAPLLTKYRSLYGDRLSGLR